MEKAGGDAVQPGSLDEDQIRIMTLEAFADTIIPGEKRSPDDRAIAGVSTGGGAVTAGALTLLEEPASGVVAGLPYLAQGLNVHAQSYAEENGLTLDDTVPAFVALSYEDRAQLILRLTKPGYAERDGWVALAQFATMAFDIAPHLHTVEALENGHPGLTQMGYLKPDADGLYRFPEFSYGKALARRHPNTTASGSPE